MKNKILAISVASAFTTLFAGNAFAVANEMTVEQENSAGTVILIQGGANNDKTTKSSISVIQKDADAATSVDVEQKNANDVEVNIGQYNGEGSKVFIRQSGGVPNDGGNDSRNIVNIIQGENGAAGTNMNNNFTVTTQTGSGNNIVGYDDADLASSATQKGALNEATLTQNGNKSTIGFNQSGVDNTAIVTQDTDSLNNRMDVSQSGSNSTVTTTQNTQSSDSTMKVLTDGAANEVVVSQGDGIAISGSTINIDIVGDNNNLGDADHKVEQLSSGSSIDITIAGDGNQANLSQGHGSAGSKMTLSNKGDLNTAEMKQVGVKNEMSLSQENSDNALLNTAVLNQNGSFDKMTVTQKNGGNAFLTQN